MRKLLWSGGVLALILVATRLTAQNAPAATADLQVYVTRQDCARLVAHHPDPGVAYQPGTDIHGKPVAPADLPGSQNLKLLPDRITFDLKLNPLAYGAPQSASNAQKFANTQIPVAHIDVDILSGAVRINGQSLDNEQTRIVTEACRKAGYR